MTPVGDVSGDFTELVIRITIDNKTVSIPFGTVISGRTCVVDWGDGAITRHSASWPADDQSTDVPSHSYLIGDYTIRISNDLESIGFAAKRVTESDSGAAAYMTALTKLGSRITKLDGNFLTRGYNISSMPSMANITEISDWGDPAWLTGQGAFWQTPVTDLSWFPSAITGTLQDYCFYNCASLTSIAALNVGDSITTVSSVAALDSQCITGVGDGTFEYCSALADLGTMRFVKSLGDYAFSRCTSLTLWPTYAIEQGYISRRAAAGEYGSVPELYSMTYGDGVFYQSGIKCVGPMRGDSRPSYGAYSFFGSAIEHIGLSASGGVEISWHYTDGTSDGTYVSLASARYRRDVVKSVSRSGNTVTMTFCGGDTMSYTVTPASGKTLKTGSELVLYKDYGNTSYADFGVNDVGISVRMSWYDNRPYKYDFTSAYLGPYCFGNCRNLVSTSGLPRDYLDWQEGLFSGCTSLSRIRYPFDYNYPIPSDEVFYNATYDEIIDPSTYDYRDFTDNTQTDGYFAKNGCHYLVKVGDSCFSGCTGLSGQVASKGFESLGASVFSGCGDGITSFWFASYAAHLYRQGVGYTYYQHYYSALRSVGPNCFNGCTYGNATGNDMFIVFDSPYAAPYFAPNAFYGMRTYAIDSWFVIGYGVSLAPYIYVRCRGSLSRFNWSGANSAVLSSNVFVADGATTATLRFGNTLDRSAGDYIPMVLSRGPLSSNPSTSNITASAFLTSHTSAGALTFTCDINIPANSVITLTGTSLTSISAGLAVVPQRLANTCTGFTAQLISVASDFEEKIATVTGSVTLYLTKQTSTFTATKTEYVVVRCTSVSGSSATVSFPPVKVTGTDVVAFTSTAPVYTGMSSLASDNTSGFLKLQQAITWGTGVDCTQIVCGAGQELTGQLNGQTARFSTKIFRNVSSSWELCDYACQCSDEVEVYVPVIVYPSGTTASYSAFYTPTLVKAKFWGYSTSSVISTDLFYTPVVQFTENFTVPSGYVAAVSSGFVGDFWHYYHPDEYAQWNPTYPTSEWYWPMTERVAMAFRLAANGDLSIDDLLNS